MEGQNNYRRLIVFAFVGGVGFIIDASILTLLSRYFSLDLYLSRAVSFTFASLGTWLLNRNITFGDVTTGVDIHGSEYVRYMAVQTGGAVINLLVFSLLIAQYPPFRELPVLPLAIGAVFGLIFNFVGTRFWVYPHQKEPGIG